MNQTAKDIAQAFGEIPEVAAVSIAGSIANDAADEHSDIDLYVYSETTVTVDKRAAIAQKRSDSIELDNNFWELGDAWIEKESGQLVEITYRSTKWIEEQLDRVLKKHEASLGYTTSLWHSIRTSKKLFDRNGWYTQLQQYASREYPAELRNAIIQKNYTVLRRLSSSYLHQIELAILRNDPVSINHRVTALLASYFDIIFAINRLPHPGEKRQIVMGEKYCSIVPKNMKKHVLKVLQQNPQTLVHDINMLIDELDIVMHSDKERN